MPGLGEPVNNHQLGILVCCIILATTSGCRRAPVDADTGPPGEPQREEPVVPAGYTKIPPAPLDTPTQMLAQTAAIFRGTLKRVHLTYDLCGGPRTVYVFEDSSSLAGLAVEPNVTLKVLGGQTPAGTWVSVSELPQLALDSEYVVFLRNTDWTYSPIVSNLVFRQETVGGRQVLVEPEGHLVTGWGEDGPTLSAATVSEPVGHQRRSLRDVPRPPPPPHATSGIPDPRTVVHATGAGNADRATPKNADASLPASASSMTAEDIRASGMFARPALTEAAVANEPSVTTESFMSSVAAAAERANVRIGGRLTLEPYWKCWSSTPTVKR
jgi:hypothetical protein